MDTLPPNAAARIVGNARTIASGSSPRARRRTPIGTAATFAATGEAAVDETLPASGRAAGSAGVGDLPLATIDPNRYGVGGELARGGMGRIVTARDRRLWRTVAIKELLTSSGDLRTRFERETRITARLQHPAIVNLLDAGMWPNGEPFYAMKLVTGESLDKVIRTHATVEERLRLLPNVIAAADALAYAHSSRIIHRDLKPANVLVGAFGETVVIDWGLAKDLATHTDDAPADVERAGGAATASDETEFGAVMGTPAYMPPEQALGEPVDERADVYALGAMLYHVLAGAPPYVAKTSAAILDAVIEGPPPDLSEREPKVPAELVTIVRKAMAHDASKRYADAAELVRDLKAFQTGRLVDAHRYSAWALFRRWVRRHRGAVTVAVIAAIVLAAVGVVSVRRIVAEQARTQQNGRDAEELMTFMLGDLRDKLKPLNKLQLLDDVARKEIAYFDRKGDELGDTDLEHAITARSNFGNVLDERGQLTQARAQYTQALELATRLVRRASPAKGYQRHVATALYNMGGMDYRQRKLPAALAEVQSALAIIAPLATVNSDSSELQHDLALIHRRLGDIQQQRDPAAALAEGRSVLAVYSALTARDPNDTRARAALADTHVFIASTFGILRKGADQVNELQTALAIQQELVAKDPDNAELRQGLMLTQASLGKAYAQAMNGRESLALYRTAIQSATQLAAADPTNPRHQSAQWSYHIGAGDALSMQGDGVGALAEYRAGLATIEAMVALAPDNVSWARSHADTLEQVGEALGMLGRYPEARTVLISARDAINSLLAKRPSDVSILMVAAQVHDGLAKLAELTHVRADVLSERRAIREMEERIAKAAPDNIELQVGLATADFDLARVLVQNNLVSEAIDQLHAARDVTEAVAAKVPHDFTNSDRGRAVHRLTGWLLLDRHDLEGALVEFQASLTLAKAIATAPHPPTYRPEDVIAAEQKMVDSTLAKLGRTH